MKPVITTAGMFVKVYYLYIITISVCNDQKGQHIDLYC